MKDHEYYRSVEVARSILTGENLKQTCEMIDYSGHRFAILHSWREQMLVSAQEDKNRGRMELALLGEIVAELLDQVPPRHSRHFDRSLHILT